MFFKVWDLTEGPRKGLGKRLDLQVGLLDRLWTAKMASWTFWTSKLSSRERFGAPSEPLWDPRRVQESPRASKNGPRAALECPRLSKCIPRELKWTPKSSPKALQEHSIIE